MIQIIPQSATFIDGYRDPGTTIELAGRTCYKSEDKMAPGTAEKMINALCKSGHESVLEHASCTIKVVTDRAIANEIVRHRAGWAYSQESTRYVNYSKDKFGRNIKVIAPIFKTHTGPMESMDLSIHKAYYAWRNGVESAERAYFEMLDAGEPPEVARDVLPLCTATEIVMTGNMRAWRHFLRLRLKGESGRPHPKIVEVSRMCASLLVEYIPTCFKEFTND